MPSQRYHLVALASLVGLVRAVYVDLPSVFLVLVRQQVKRHCPTFLGVLHSVLHETLPTYGEPLAVGGEGQGVDHSVKAGPDRHAERFLTMANELACILVPLPDLHRPVPPRDVECMRAAKSHSHHRARRPFGFEAQDPVRNGFFGRLFRFGRGLVSASRWTSGTSPKFNLRSCRG